MFENITKFLKKFKKSEIQDTSSKETAKERLHLVLMQDRANVSVDFLEMMKQEIIEVIKKYIDVDENAIDVRLTNKTNDDGTNGAPALYANIPIISIKDEKKAEINENKVESKKESTEKGTIKDESKEEETENKKSKNATKNEAKTENKKETNKINEDKKNKNAKSQEKEDSTSNENNTEKKSGENVETESSN